jgi:hypothetical protein
MLASVLHVNSVDSLRCEISENSCVIASQINICFIFAYIRIFASNRIFAWKRIFAAHPIGEAEAGQQDRPQTTKARLHFTGHHMSVVNMTKPKTGETEKLSYLQV